MIRYSFIVLCFIISIFYKRENCEKKDKTLLVLALAFTVIADYFFIFTTKYMIGIAFFFVVQNIYNYRFTGAKREIKLLCLACFLFVALQFFRIDTLIKMAILYGLSLCFSVSASFIAYKNKKYNYPQNVIIPIAMILFLLCDINVGLSYMRNNTMFYNLIWVFYLPSQFLLAIS